MRFMALSCPDLRLRHLYTVPDTPRVAVLFDSTSSLGAFGFSRSCGVRLLPTRNSWRECDKNSYQIILGAYGVVYKCLNRESGQLGAIYNGDTKSRYEFLERPPNARRSALGVSWCITTLQLTFFFFGKHSCMSNPMMRNLEEQQNSNVDLLSQLELREHLTERMANAEGIVNTKMAEINAAGIIGEVVNSNSRSGSPTSPCCCRSNSIENSSTAHPIRLDPIYPTLDMYYRLPPKYLRFLANFCVSS
eukprot:TsM_000194800 transcript=TsM_000194800 gene=TsM_000194800